MQKTCRDRRSNVPSTIVAGILARFLAQILARFLAPILTPILALFLVHLTLQRLYLLDAVKTQLEHCIGQA